MKRLLPITIFLIICVLAISNTASYAGKADDTLNVAFVQEIPTFDAYFNTARQSTVLARHFWDNLLYRDPKTYEYKPLLASSYKFIDDVTMEFELRKGVKFHNGEEFDADDVVYTLNWVSNPDNRVKVQNLVNWIKKVEKLGKYKVRLIMAKPFPAALEYLSGSNPIYPNEYYAKVGPEGMGVNPIGTGPYKTLNVKHGRELTLVKNEDYFDNSPKGKPSISKIVIKTLPEVNTQIAEIMSGRLNWMWQIPQDQAENLARIPKVVVNNAQTMRIGYLQFDAANRSGKDSPVTKLKVRQAISHAIDRQKIVDSLVKGASVVVHSACFPTQFGCTSDVLKYEYNPEKAKKLLAEAGYPNGFEIDFYAYRNRDWAEAILGSLSEVGIKAKLQYINYPTLRDKVRQGGVELNFMTWGSMSINDASAITGHFFKHGGDDLAMDADVKTELDIADNSIDPNLRKSHYKKALQRIAAQAYWLPLWSYSTNYAQTKDLDFTLTPDEMPRFFTAKWK